MPDGPRKIRFGVFEADLAAGELRRNGSKVKLQDQPFQVLAALLEKPGEVVTKEELQERIWKDDTYVDFDRSLATAVNKIRQALGDSATRPRFIETVPKRGYRFLAVPPKFEPVDPPIARPDRWKRIAAGGLAGMAAVAAWFLFARDAEVRWSDPRRITHDDGLTYQPAISPDGKLVAYASDRAGNLDIWLQQLPDGDPIRITDDPADDASPHFSPDGQSIVFQSGRNGGGIYVVSALGGGTPLRIADAGERPRFSSDGRWIAFLPAQTGDMKELHAEVAIVPVSGGKARRLVSQARPILNMRPVWSPDSSAVLIMGSENAFSYRGLEWRRVSVEGDDLGVVDAVEALRNAAATASRQWFNPAQWDADGYIYFAAGHPSGVDLWRILADPKSASVKGEPERVAGGAGRFRDPSAAAGGRLLFASYSENTDVWSLAVDTDRAVQTAREPVRLTTAEGEDSDPSVSLDGSRVVFQSSRSGDLEVWTLDSSTGRETRLIAGSRPVINDAGNRLALRLAGGEDGQPERLAILATDGVIGKEFQQPDRAWDWSPDERSILLGDGSRVLHLDVESGVTAELFSENEAVLYQASFSSDGRWIAWLRLPAELWIAPFRGPQTIPRSDWVRIPDESNTADKPRWSPNGNLLYYIAQRDGFECIYAQPLDPDTKQPKGEPFAVYHRHDSRLRVGSRGRLAMSVARDKIVFCMTELKSNIWMTEPVE